MIKFRSVLLPLLAIGTQSFVVLQTHTFFEYITVWQAPSGQLVYGVADCHDIKGGDQEVLSLWHSATLDGALDAVDTLVKKHGRNSVVAFVEDIIDYHGDCSSVQGFVKRYRDTYWAKSYHDGPLIDLAVRLRRKGILVTNMEYRFLRTAGLCTVQDRVQPSADGQYPLHEWPVSGREIVKEYEETAAEIGRYADTPLQDYYQETRKTVQDCCAGELEKVRQDGEDVVHYINTHIPVEERFNFGRGLVHFDAPLLDARLLHQIINEQRAERIILFCGFLHIHNVGLILKRLLHYKELAHIGLKQDFAYQPAPFKTPDGTAKRIARPLEMDQLALLGADAPVFG